ncbi:hypothetical protein ACFY5D_06880 [Paeniglutamicibacter sp. NPDC012692]|uniref:hypothetical protein n=1 Tax=Paeniglutamicibacter sp. NPDC012692 TaxID=3364388 RepID=UPI0036A81C3E
MPASTRERTDQPRREALDLGRMSRSVSGGAVPAWLVVNVVAVVIIVIVVGQ